MRGGPRTCKPAGVNPKDVPGDGGPRSLQAPAGLRARGVLRRFLVSACALLLDMRGPRLQALRPLGAN
jgi:hypothetical protein